MQDKPLEALAFLESAASEDPSNVQAFLYLGFVYLQLDRKEDAIEAYRTILPNGGAETARIAFNLGNVYFSKDDFSMALQYYSQAVEADPSYASAFLNRANLLVKSGDLSNALADYEAYLSIESESSQREALEKLMALIQEELSAEEQQSFATGEPVKIEVDRRAQFLLEVAESLKTVGEDSKRLSAGDSSF